MGDMGLYENTTTGSGPYFTSVRRTFIYFASVSFFIVLGNSVMLGVVCKKRRRKPTDFLLGALAITDLIIPIVVFPLLVAHGITGTWTGGRASCYVNAFASMFLLKFSMLITSIIAVDRFLAIGKPFIYRSKFNLRKMRIALVIGAMYSFTVSLIPLVGMVCSEGEPKWHLCFYHWAAGRTKALTSIYVIINVVDTSLAALTVLICNIGVIGYFLKRRENRKTRIVPASGNDLQTHKQNIRRRRNDLKYARLMVVVSLYFLLCYLPIQVLIIMYQYGGMLLKPKSIVRYQLHIVSINLLFDPLLHALIRKHYRRAYWFILRHPLAFFGFSSNHQFDFDGDQRDQFDFRPANLRELTIAVIAATRFKANRRIHTGPNDTSTDSKVVPKIVKREMSLESDTHMNDTHQLSPFSSSRDLGRLSSATECSESAPLNLLQIPTRPFRRESRTSYFSDQDSLPPSPSFLHVPLPNFHEQRRGASISSDADSDAVTVCSHLPNDSRLSMTSILSESPSDDTPGEKRLPKYLPPLHLEVGTLQGASPETSKTAWSPLEYIKPAQEIENIIVKRNKRRKKKRKITEKASSGPPDSQAPGQ